MNSEEMYFIGGMIKESFIFFGTINSWGRKINNTKDV